jgi:hypothetical protein
MVEYALLISRNSLSLLAGEVNSVASAVNLNWLLVGAIVFGLIFVRSALKPPRI